MRSLRAMILSLVYIAIPIVALAQQPPSAETFGCGGEIVRTPLGHDECFDRFLVNEDWVQYNVILRKDNLRFRVAQAAAAVTITQPQQDAEVGLRELLLITVLDAGPHVYVLVHPLLTDTWWVQRRPGPANAAGEWQSIAQFGEGDAGINEYFEIVALATQAPNQFQVGEKIDGARMSDLLTQYPHSDLVLVKRVR